MAALTTPYSERRKMPALPAAEPIRQQVIPPSPTLAKFMRHVMTIPGIQPCHLDDVMDTLDETPDDKLADIIGEADGCLRDALWEELAEMDIHMPSDNCAWVVELLGEGTVTIPGMERCDGEAAKAA